MQKKRVLVTASLLMAVSLTWAADGTALKNAELRAEPFRDAKVVAQLVKGDKVDILQREGAWMEVKSNKGNGWVHMLSIRRAGAGKDTREQGGVLALDSGRAGSAGMVATTGIRGLDSSAAGSGLSDDALKAAKFNEAELMRDESYATVNDKAQQFAKQGGLAARPVEQLPDEAAR